MIALLDADHIANRAYYALADYRGLEDQPAGLIYGFLNSLKAINKQLMPTFTVICWGDHRDNLWRREVLPAYKAHRSKTDASFISQVNITKSLFRNMGLCQVLCPTFEADDCIAAICADCIEADKEVGIVSGDHDMYQLIRDKAPLVRCYVPIKGRGYVKTTRKDVIKKFGVPPELLPKLMAMRGEKGDGVPGIVGIGRQRAKDYIRGEASPAITEKIEAHQELIDFNLKLVSLREIDTNTLTPSTLPVMPGEYNELKVLNLLRQVGLTGSHSALSSVRSIVEFNLEVQSRGANSMAEIMKED